MARRKITHIPLSFRPHTGPLQFGGDWPGVFLRGDECGEYCKAIELVRGAIKQQAMSGKSPESVEAELLGALSSLQELSRLLKSCRLKPQQWVRSV